MKSCLNGVTVRTTPLERELSLASDAGFEGVELWWEKVAAYLVTNRVENLKNLLQVNRLVPASICPLRIWPFRDSELARIEYREAVHVAAGIGCDLLIVCPDFQPASLNRAEAMNVHAKELLEMAEMAADSGIRLAIEPIGMHTLVPGPKEALELIDMAGAPDNVGLLMDSFHYFRSLVAIEDIGRIPVEKLFMVHVNDSEDKPINELTDADRLYPGDGVLPLSGYFTALKNINYAGFVSVEIFRPEYRDDDPVEVVASSYLKLAQYI